ncbi:MAG: class I SAM-dependent methyltransferase [Planctomycetota bacterium]
MTDSRPPAAKPFPVDRYTRLTQAWLDIRYQDPHGHGAGVYYAHEPIYGLGAPQCEPHHARRVMRLFQLLRRVREAGGRTLLDVGGAEGYFAKLCEELFGMEVVSVDISAEACRRAAEIFAVPGCAVDAAQMPFATGSFDLVTCAEVVEHLAAPVESILELQRVAKATLVLATEEWFPTEEARDHELAERSSRPHGERSLFADADMRCLFSPYKVQFERQVVPSVASFGDDRAIDVGALRRALLRPQDKLGKGEGHEGIVAFIRKQTQRIEPPRTPTDEEIVDHLLSRAVPVHKLPAPTPSLAWPAWCHMRCVVCQRQLDGSAAGWRCGGCDQAYPLERGVASFVRGLPPFQARLAAMLEERGGEAYSGQGRDLLALAGKLAMDFVPTSHWQRDGSETFESWSAEGDLAPGGRQGVYRSAADDPQLLSPWLGLDVGKGRRAEVSLAVRPTDPAVHETLVEFFWWVDGDGYFKVERSDRKVVPADGQRRQVTFTLPTDVDPDALLLKVRLDPAITPSAIEVFEVRLSA